LPRLAPSRHEGCPRKGEGEGEGFRRSRTFNDDWKRYIEEQRDRGVEFDDEYVEDFNLS
jgi:hypothetical protein